MYMYQMGISSQGNTDREDGCVYSDARIHATECRRTQRHAIFFWNRETLRRRKLGTRTMCVLDIVEKGRT